MNQTSNGDIEENNKKSFQWQLWESCNNGCPFCYLGKNNRSVDKAYQLQSLERLKNTLRTLDFSIYGNVSLIGGEFFQGQLADAEVRASFLELIRMLSDLYVGRTIESIWITSTLTIGDQADLYKTLDIFENAGAGLKEGGSRRGIWLCTSWDARGRFRTKKQKDNWESHMKRLSEEYPNLKKNTSIILMQDLCEDYLNNNFRPRDFMQKFKTTLSYKQPGLFIYGEKDFGELLGFDRRSDDSCVDEFVKRRKQYYENLAGFSFYPKRETFRRFLVKYAREDSESFDLIMNNELRADAVHVNSEDGTDGNIQRDKKSNVFSRAFVESVINDHCRVQEKTKMHVINYEVYIDSKECMLCDIKQIRESFLKV